jgi:20S proteasome alpha/beta subunit
VKSLETRFHQDLDGDGVIGLAPRQIEAAGATSLFQIGSAYALESASGPQLRYQGQAVAAGQFGTWKPLGAEATANGYQVVWKAGTADQYTVWTVDRTGNYLASATGVVAGSSTVLAGLETRFQQDLNGDGAIGLAGRTIESLGATALVQFADNYFLGGLVGPQLRFQGQAVAAGQFGTWKPIAAEATAGGYQVAWKAGDSDQYTVWSTDQAGNYVASPIGAVAGGSAALESLETGFRQDLNGDGIVGLVSTLIESAGATSLTGIGDAFALGGADGPHLRYGGADVVAGQFAAWTPIAAEQTAHGYAVAWHWTGSDQYLVWSTDAAGNYQNSGPGVMTAGSTALKQFEAGFHQDLDGNGSIGDPSLLVNMAAGTFASSSGSTGTGSAPSIPTLDELLARPVG